MNGDRLGKETSNPQEAAKPVLCRWIKALWLVGIGTFLAAGVSYFPPLNGPARWCMKILAVAGVLCLLCMGSVYRRYRRAALFRGAVVLFLPAAGLLITGRTPVILLPALEMLCGLAATCQEFRGHSDVVSANDGKLAGQWMRLMWVSLAINGLRYGEVLLVSALFFRGDLSTLAAGRLAQTVWLAVVGAAGMLLEVVYLCYLYRTLRSIKISA